MPSITCLRLSDVSVIGPVTYFHFPIQSAFLPYRSPCSTPMYWFTQYGTSHVAENLGRYLSCTEDLSCTERTFQGNDFELILTVKMETRHPVNGSFNSEFPAICNHCGVTKAWSRKTFNIFEKFLRFFGKTTPYDHRRTKRGPGGWHVPPPKKKLSSGKAALVGNEHRFISVNNWSRGLSSEQ